MGFPSDQRGLNSHLQLLQGHLEDLGEETMFTCMDSASDPQHLHPSKGSQVEGNVKLWNSLMEIPESHCCQSEAASILPGGGGG